jgi:hypothetical protein
MKTSIISIIYFIIQAGLPVLFSANGFGVTTWQWWTLSIGIFLSYILGVIKGAD